MDSRRFSLNDTLHYSNKFSLTLQILIKCAIQIELNLLILEFSGKKIWFIFLTEDSIRNFP